jgi:UDP-3-O-[3-hydroxymyristoyl] glucosamine N-acyltransferase
MNVTLTELVREFAHIDLQPQSPDQGERVVHRIAAVEQCGPGDLVFVDKPERLCHVREREPTALVTSNRHAELAATQTSAAVLRVPNLSLAHALIKQRHGARDLAASGWLGQHPTAVIHPTAIVDPTATIEPRVVIGARSRIGAHCRIMAGAVIENDVVLGERSVIHPLVVIGYGCILGADVVVESGSVIGSQGFGFAQDAARHSHAIPQTGIVMIADRVRIGANNCIDRATYQVTRIGAGTKFDNLCHVAHNVTIGEDCLLTAMLCVAGSSRIGNRVITSGQTGIIDHVEICDDVVLVHRAGVIKSIREPGVHAALPAQPLDDYLKSTAVVRAAPELRRRVAELEKGRTRADD